MKPKETVRDPLIRQIRASAEFSLALSDVVERYSLSPKQVLEILSYELAERIARLPPRRKS